MLTGLGSVCPGLSLGEAQWPVPGCTEATACGFLPGDSGCSFSVLEATLLQTPELGSGMQATAHPNPACTHSYEGSWVHPWCLRQPRPHTSTWLQNQLPPPEPRFRASARTWPQDRVANRSCRGWRRKAKGVAWQQQDQAPDCWGEHRGLLGDI